MSSTIKCKAITEAGIQCNRNAVIDGYCTQHHKKMEEKQYPSIAEDIAIKSELDRLEIIENFDPIIKSRNIKTYCNGVLTKEEQWHPNGEKWIENNYKNNKQNGKSYYWYSNGKKYYDCNFKDGKYEGKQYFWYNNEELKYVHTYINGKLEGTQYRWYENGN
jgi:hypothetical protein